MAFLMTSLCFKKVVRYFEDKTSNHAVTRVAIYTLRGCVQDSKG
jgi:hypothetical protein